MRAVALLLALGLVGCGDEQSAATDSGVEGVVQLGPQCPVEVEGQPCDDKPAAAVEVTVSKQVPGEMYGGGEPVAHTTTDALGRFRVAVKPGAYVVTAEAGMFCEFMDTRVVAGEYVTVDVPCDTGIR